MSSVSNRIYTAWYTPEINMERPEVIVIQMIWNQMTILFSVIGNTFVIYATLCHKAIKIDKMSIWIINNVCVVDISNSCLVLLPSLITQYKGNWMFGESFCYIHFTYRYSFFVANIVLLNFLSLNKLLRCLYPLRNLSSSRRQRVIVTVIAAALSAIPMCWTLYLWRQDFLRLDMKGHGGQLYPRTLGTLQICMTYVSSSDMLTVNIVLMILLNGVFCVMMVVTTLTLLVYAIKMTDRPIVKKRILIVISICVSFIVSFIPTGICYIYGDLPAEAAEFAWSITFMSAWINPVIYLVVNESFRNFTKKMICCAWRSPVIRPGSDLHVTVQSAL